MQSVSSSGSAQQDGRRCSTSQNVSETNAAPWRTVISRSSFTGYSERESSHVETCGVRERLRKWAGLEAAACVSPGVGGALCWLGVMEEAISPASRPHHKPVSCSKETRWIITRGDSLPRSPPPPHSEPLSL
ncbi:unnamed protein product [Pleuronectes platessa]|uniref:Uncharacterized protein n=1 Tax=Pleuronectes platessa TaxID=8262 RepID=A0A9N7UG02_PLEPL|nr:unnamed protein product [Pleuronectes platessa]